MTRAEVDEKCYDLMAPVLGSARARKLCDAVWHLDRMRDARERHQPFKLVLNGDTTDEELLEDENIAEMDLFVAVTNDDENNIMSSLLAKRMGAGRVVALINRRAYVDLLQAGAIDVLQLDAARVGGVNENLAILLLAARFGVPVCPHAGGVGLCELVQHLSMFDFVALSGTTENRVIEYVDHLHEHFVDPVVIRDGHYTAPTAPGFSATMRPESLAEFSYPGGAFWAADLAQEAASADRTAGAPSTAPTAPTAPATNSATTATTAKKKAAQKGAAA